MNVVRESTMIVDNIANFNKYLSLHKDFKQVADFLKQNDLKTMDCGKYEIDGSNVYLALQQYQTKPQDICKPEAHKNYIDIQIVVSGEENIGYADILNTSKCTEYDSEKDIEFLNGEVEFIRATPDKFFILYPQDAHMPSVAINNPSDVKKAVFKIKLV